MTALRDISHCGSGIYGRFTTVRAAASNGFEAEPLQLPGDGNNNWIPDMGWKATANGVVISSLIQDGAFSFRDDDIDTNSTGNGVVGDGLIHL
jgi:hypothetical protein